MCLHRKREVPFVVILIITIFSNIGMLIKLRGKKIMSQNCKKFDVFFKKVQYIHIFLPQQFPNIKNINKVCIKQPGELIHYTYPQTVNVYKFSHSRENLFNLSIATEHKNCRVYWSHTQKRRD